MSNNPKHGPDPRATYTFYIAAAGAPPEGVQDAERTYVYWRGLSLVQARNMYAWTDKFPPRNVVAFGWEVEKA